MPGAFTNDTSYLHFVVIIIKLFIRSSVLKKKCLTQRKKIFRFQFEYTKMNVGGVDWSGGYGRRLMPVSSNPSTGCYLDGSFSTSICCKYEGVMFEKNRK